MYMRGMGWNGIRSESLSEGHQELRGTLYRTGTFINSLNEKLNTERVHIGLLCSNATCSKLERYRPAAHRAVASVDTLLCK